MCSLCRLPEAKNHNFGQILTFGGSCTDPLLPMRSKFSAACARADHGVRYVPNLVSIGLFLSHSCSDKTQFFPFLDFDILWCHHCRQSDKVEYGCTTINQGITIVYAFMSKSGAQTLTFKSVMNKHTKTQRFWPLRRRLNSDTHQTWHR